MKAFDFVNRDGTAIHVEIDGRVLTPATFPIPMNGHKVYFIRHASNPVIGEINPSGTQPVVIENAMPGINKSGDMNLDMDADKVKSCRIESGPDTIELKFDNGFPNLLSLQQNKKTYGHWEYAVSSAVLFGGTYTLLREKEKVSIEFDITRKWKPGALPFSYRLVTLFVRSFRTWPTTYKWKGTVDLTNNSIINETWLRK
jgi:hypothetical protein